MNSLFSKSTNGTSTSTGGAVITTNTLFNIKKDTTITGSAIISGDCSVGSTTASTSTTTGALKCSGGAGISGNIYVGGTQCSLSQYSMPFKGIQFGNQGFSGIGAPVNITFATPFPSGSNVIITLGTEGLTDSTHYYGGAISSKSISGFTLNPLVISFLSGLGNVSNNGGYNINWIAIAY